MDIRVTTEQHFYRCPAGVFVLGDEDAAFFERYKSVFERVQVLGRVVRVPSPPPAARRVDGDGISVVDLPEFRGTRGYLKYTLPILARLNQLVAGDTTCYLLRLPGGIASLTWLTLRRAGRPYGVEVVADPALAFTVQAYGSGDAKILRPFAVRLLRAQAAGAAAAAYVTSTTLQQSYPPGCADSYTYSSLDIGDEAFAFAEGTLERIERQPDVLPAARLVFVGRLRLPMKGLDTLIDAVGRLRAEGVELKLRVIGGGELLETYRRQAGDLGVADAVSFDGELTDRRELLERVAQSDLFVLPSRREGLPRALIEAMALGLPCVASDIGGTPELLPPDDLVRPDDPGALARRIREFLSSKSRRREAARRNAGGARRFARERVREQRRLFYAALLERTAKRTPSRHANGSE